MSFRSGLRSMVSGGHSKEDKNGPPDDGELLRILLVGKTGAGKTSVIKRIFGADDKDLIVSHDKPGHAAIEKGYTSKANRRFILHDSEGFELGCTAQCDIVRSFIDDRTNSPENGENIDALWLCVPVPIVNNRVIDLGDEYILKMKIPVPVIVVFTKYDELREAKFAEIKRKKPFLKTEQIEKEAAVAAEKVFQELCIGPLTYLTGRSDFPHVRVSVFDDGGNQQLDKVTRGLVAAEVHRRVGATPPRN